MTAEQPVTDVPEYHKSGYIAVLGRPNVGKSTLINALLGEKVSIVSPKPQTTRDRIQGILSLEEAQIIFLDTPGIHQPKNMLDEYMVKVANYALPDADVILFLVDVANPLIEADREIARLIEKKRENKPVLVGLNKIDQQTDPAQVATIQTELATLLPDATFLPLSATTGAHQDELLEWIIEKLPYGPRYYPVDIISDQNDRKFVAEIIREVSLELLHHEVPHGMAVIIDTFKTRENGMLYIQGKIYVERESHKPIVLGKNGSMLKRIGQRARQRLEEIYEQKIYLDLRVKPRHKWRKNPSDLRWFGYVTRKK
ncbi:MAG: GTPase Era [Gemmatimonadetes bacterium]|nr:MAG: GTPase Era [Gemmatimonadota bacterium]